MFIQVHYENGEAVTVNTEHIIAIRGRRIYLDGCIEPNVYANGAAALNTIIYTAEDENKLNRIIAEVNSGE